MKVQHCRSCQARVIWAINVKTKSKAPIDADPVEDGIVVFTHQPGMGGDPEYRVLDKIERNAVLTGPRYSNHFKTCPNAKQHKKGGR